jgi:hypothetical protein
MHRRNPEIIYTFVPGALHGQEKAVCMNPCRHYLAIFGKVIPDLIEKLADLFLARL